MNWFFIVAISFLLPIVLLIAFVFHTLEMNNGITILEMHRFERDVSQNLRPIFDQKDCFEVANELKLFIEKDVDSSTINNKESQLGPTNKDGYNGEILIAKTDVAYLPNFRCYHELVHYFKDVGRGKKVSKVYGKDPQGETRSHWEQVINYYAAAIAVPKDALLEDIKHIHSPAENGELIRELAHKYKQPESTVLRRIEEVLRL